MFLRQGTAVDLLIGPFINTSGVEQGGESPAVKLSKNGQALAAKSDATTPVHDSDGEYNCELDANDTDTEGSLVLVVPDSGTAMQVRHERQVVSKAVFDTIYAAGALGPGVLRYGTAQAGTASSITLDAGASAENDLYLGLKASIIAGTGAGQSRFIINYTGSTKIADIYPNWITNPASDSVFVLESHAPVDIRLWRGSTPNILISGLVDAQATVFGTPALDEINIVKAQVAALNDISAGDILPKKNIAFSNIPFLLVSDTDHVTPVTGATGKTVNRSIDSGAWTAGSGTIAEVGNGMYQYDASPADMNGGIITFRFSATGGVPSAPDDAFVTIITDGFGG